MVYPKGPKVTPKLGWKGWTVKIHTDQNKQTCVFFLLVVAFLEARSPFENLGPPQYP